MGNLRTSMRRRGNHIKAGISKRSPEILLASGIITSLAATGTAIKATIDIQDEWKELSEEIEQIKANFDRDEELYCIETDTEIIEYEGSDALDVYREDLARAYVKRLLLIGKYYGLPIALEATAIGSMFGSNKISRKRNATLGAALGASQAAYESLKNNLINAVGEEEADLIEMGLKKEKVTKKVKDENGKTKKVTEDIIVPIDEEGYVTNPWVIKITPDMPIWTHDWRNLVEVLGVKRNYWENVMITRAPEDRGVFFNEIVADMGIDGRKEGQIFGYKYNKYDDRPDVIDFGIKVVEASAEDKIKYNVCKMVYLNFRPRRIIDECYRGFVDDVATARNQWNRPGDFANKGINTHTF
jgi:hypothetical protein